MTMRNQKPTALDVFNYLRGALRGLYGVEDFRGKSVLLIGVNRFGQDLLNKICFDKGVALYFSGDPERSLGNYHNALSVCSLVEPWEGQKTDIVIDTLSKCLTVAQEPVSFENIGKKSYTQGIHDFYLQNAARRNGKWSGRTPSVPSTKGENSWRGSRR